MSPKISVALPRMLAAGPQTRARSSVDSGHGSMPWRYSTGQTGSRCLRARPDTRSEWRTTVALELAAARLLAQGAAPAMPRFAAKLNKALGHAGAPADWPDYVALVAPGSAVSLAGVTFFTLLPSDSAEALPAEVAEVA